MKPTKNAIPKHIAIILDGNRRFSKKLMLKPWKGHEWGAKKVEMLLEVIDKYDITEMTLYCFSTENFNRPKIEFDFLMNLFRKEFDKIKADKRIKEKQVRLNFIGRLYMFPKDIHDKMDDLMEITKNHKRFTLNFAMAYGGQSEIVDAAKKIAKEVKDGKLDINKINEELFSEKLYMSSCPDLIIRTAGEKRSSNFLPYQSVYSEWFYLEKSWPEFTEEDLVKVIDDYKQRNRTYGK